ncbi:MAG: hypothetical protein D6714_02010 [Bacteroidetes bacterium]|nr:MAG: hypothetical protein D6714_02010 [Bacteroidota bacterium]
MPSTISFEKRLPAFRFVGKTKFGAREVLELVGKKCPVFVSEVAPSQAFSYCFFILRFRRKKKPTAASCPHTSSFKRNPRRQKLQKINPAAVPEANRTIRFSPKKTRPPALKR